MSLSSVGAAGLGDQSQVLAQMLSRLDGSRAIKADTSAKKAVTATAANSPAPGAPAKTALTGTDKSKLSDQILALLVRLQQQPPAGNATTALNNGSAAGSGSTTDKPAHALFSAMDGNRDGAVTQSEMETYIQRQGGTQSQADKLFTALSRKTSSAISEHQLASDIAQALKTQHHRRQHHQAVGAPPSSSGNTSSTDLASQIFGELDGNTDGTLSAAELTAGGLLDPTRSFGPSSVPIANPSNSPANLDTDRNGSVSASEFASFFSSLQSQTQSDTATMANLLQKASQAYGSAASISRAANAMQS